METKIEKPTPWRAVHPGEILGEELKERHIMQKDFALKIGMQPSHLNEFIKGRRNMNEELAIKLEQALGIPYRLWMNAHAVYMYDLKAIKIRERQEQLKQESVLEEV